MSFLKRLLVVKNNLSARAISEGKKGMCVTVNLAAAEYGK